MAPIRPSDVVVTGACALTVAPQSAIAPQRWAGKEARLARMDRLCGLAVVACDGALLDAGLSATAAEWQGERTAIVFGTAYGCHATNEDYYRGFVRQGPPGASPRLFAATLPSSPVGEVSIHYGVRGPTTTLANGLTSGLDAFAEAVATIAAGRADRALVCAAEVATPLLSRILDGAALVDASAALLLERAADAAARGATPRGRLVAAASLFAPGARAVAVAAAIERVLAEAELPAGAPRHLLASAPDVAAARSVGVAAARSVGGAAASDGEAADAGALGAAPLVAIARWLLVAERDSLALMAVGDEGGAGSAAVIVAG